MTQIHELTVVELAAAVRAGDLSPVAVTDHYLHRASALNDLVGAFYTITAELAADQAMAAEKAVANTADPARLPPLTGVPIPVKDLNRVAGVRQTQGSLAHAGDVPETDDYVVQRLREAGAVITGKTATPEFGLPCYTESRIGPPARTPWDLSRSAGGSSGGAAAAVAAGLAPAAQGSDGGGSIRIPASVCGLVGLKPSRGRVSAGPVAPDLAGLTANGPITRTVADAALLLDVMSGNYPGDLYTQSPLPPGESFFGHAGRPPGRLRIGRTLGNPMGAEVHPDCVLAYQEASTLLASLGHEVEDIPMPVGADAVPLFEVLWYSCAALIPVLPGRDELLRPLTRYLRARGAAITAAELLLAQGGLQSATRAAAAALHGYDAVLTPALAQPPVPVGHFDEADPAANFEEQKRFTPFTAVYNVTGQPAISLPLHWTAAGLPIGVMLASRSGAEGLLISLSAQLEAARPWQHRHPPLWSWTGPTDNQPRDLPAPCCSGSASQQRVLQADDRGRPADLPAGDEAADLGERHPADRLGLVRVRRPGPFGPPGQVDLVRAVRGPRHRLECQHMLDRARPVAGFLQHLTGRSGRTVLAVLDVAAGQLPYPPVGDEAVPPDQQHPLRGVIQHHRHRAPRHPQHVLLEPEPVRQLDRGHAQPGVRVLGDLALREHRPLRASPSLGHLPEATGWPAAAYRGSSPIRYSRVRSSSCCFRSSLRTYSAAARLASSCSGLLAPMIGAVMAGLASTQATARVTRLVPALSASWISSPTVSNSRSCQ
jgi:amidase